MHEEIVQIVLLGTDVGLSCEPSQSFLEHEDSQRIYPIDQGVDPQVKLEPIDQVWFLHVLLHNVGLFLWNLAEIVCQKDALTLRTTIGLDYQREACLLSKVRGVCWRLALFLSRSQAEAINTFSCTKLVRNRRVSHFCCGFITFLVKFVG